VSNYKVLGQFAGEAVVEDGVRTSMLWAMLSLIVIEMVASVRKE